MSARPRRIALHGRTIGRTARLPVTSSELWTALEHGQPAGQPVARAGGALTLGDTHSSDEPFPFEFDEQPYRHLYGVATGLLGDGLPPIVRRWAGVYSQVADSSGAVPYFRADLAPGVQVVTGPGGRGMTMAPAIAGETFR